MTTLVIGATGTVGSRVVDELLGRGLAVRAFVRDRARAATVLDRRAEPADGDVTDPVSVRAALDGVERVFLCTPNQSTRVTSRPWPRWCPPEKVTRDGPTRSPGPRP